MKIILLTCDGCNYDLSADRSSGAYVLSHESVLGGSIMGDNRIYKEQHYCKGCFGQIHKFISTTLNPSSQK